jgi:hypothetical protein
MIKNSLPNISVEENVKTRPYPFQIAYQAKEFIQGAIFYASIADMSSGEFFLQKGALETIEKRFYSGGGEKELWELGWKLLGKYQKIFEITVFQNVLIAINSHWDWYIRNLSNFVSFARQYVASPTSNRQEEKELNRIGSLSICHQLAVLEKSCGVSFGIMEKELEVLNEMSLVRNLALHNRWEVDQKYLDKASSKKHWNIGELRFFDSSELGVWHRGLIEALEKTSMAIANKYLSAPTFPGK